MTDNGRPELTPAMAADMGMAIAIRLFEYKANGQTTGDGNVFKTIAIEVATRLGFQVSDCGYNVIIKDECGNEVCNMAFNDEFR